MVLKDYEDFAEKPLEFPYRGKTYVMQPLGIEEGLRLAGIVAKPEDSGMSGAELWQFLLGPLWDEMVADRVPLDFATRCGLTALADYQYGREVAEATWEAGADPNRLAALLRQKAAPNRATRRSKSTGAAKSTQ